MYIKPQLNIENIVCLSNLQHRVKNSTLYSKLAYALYSWTEIVDVADVLAKNCLSILLADIEQH